MNWITDLGIWMPPGFIKENPSMRLRRLNLRKPLRKLGVRADLIYRKEDLAPFQNILLCHFNEEAIQFCKEARAQGKTLLFCHTENLWGLEHQTEVFNLCDYIVCCSTLLAQFTQARLTSPFTKCVVIPDMAEGPYPTNGLPLHQPKEKEQLTCVYSGMGGNSYLAKNLKPIIEKLGMKLIIISEHQDADIQWNRDTYQQEMAKADIAICPQNWELQPAKSNVKVSTSQAIGLPTIASPTQAYKEIIQEGFNGFIATTDAEWENALVQLKDYKTRLHMSRAAWETGLQYWPMAIAEKYRDFLLTCKKQVGFINNTLNPKYLSYGDRLLEKLRYAGDATYEEFRYEDIDDLPDDYDMHIFVEVRYDPEDLPITTFETVYNGSKSEIRLSSVPRILITKEDQNINNFAHFNLILTPNKQLADQWYSRGFVNVQWIENLDNLTYPLLRSLVNEDISAKRARHNLVLHDAHINSFYQLLYPEQRWVESGRDGDCIRYSMANTREGEAVLDIGSADGWLTTYLAKHGRNMSALEFVERGIAWTKEQAQRLGLTIDLRRGSLENVDEVFKDRKFDVIILYEVMEHLDHWRLSWYLQKLKKLLKVEGRLLISVPSQPVQNNLEHLWTPTQKLIEKNFKNSEISWVSLKDAPIPGNWFIKI